MTNTKTRAQGATEYLIILAATLVVTALAVFYVSRGVPFPAISVIAKTDTATGDNIQLEVPTAGSIPAGDWQYRLTQTKGTGTWETKNVALAQGTINLENKAASAGTWYVSVKHIPSGHLYLDDVSVTVA